MFLTVSVEGPSPETSVYHPDNTAKDSVCAKSRIFFSGLCRVGYFTHQSLTW